MMMTTASSAAARSPAPVFSRNPDAATRGPSRPRPRSEWPQARLDQLRALFDEGLSHLLIAGRMKVGKGVVSAKLARLGWVREATLSAAAPQPRVAPQLIIDPGRLRRLEFLGPRDCHWPVTEDAQGVQLFCGCPKAREIPYCPGHQAGAFRRPFGWERQVLEAGPRRPAMREGLGWDRFRNTPPADGRGAP
jgi:hypothetical protein